MNQKQHSIPGFYCGTSNIVLPVANKAQFPPEYRDKSRLHYYATLFNSLEVNSTFYKIPLGKTIERWEKEVPEDFRFTFKLWRGITHARELQYEVEDIQHFLEVINRIGNKKGCLLVQFPASIKLSFYNRLKKLLDDITNTGSGREWSLAVEFRDKSWYCDKVYEMLEYYHAAVVIHDMPQSATPVIDMDSDFVFYRYHGENGDYKGSYNRDLLEEHARDIKDWIANGKTVYAYFNNTIGAAVHNALDLYSYFSE